MSVSRTSIQQPSQYPPANQTVSSNHSSNATSTAAPEEDPLRKFLNRFPDEAIRSAIFSECSRFKDEGNQSVTALLTKNIISNPSDTLSHVQRLISIAEHKKFIFKMDLKSDKCIEGTLPQFFLKFEDWSEMIGNVDPFQSGIEEDREKERSFDALLSLGIYFYRKKSQEPRFVDWVENNIGQRFFVGGVALAFANAIEDDELYNFFCQRIAPNCKDSVIKKAFYLSFLFDRETSSYGPKKSVLCMQKIFNLSETAISQDLLLRCLAENCQRIRSSKVARYLLSKIMPNDLNSISERWPSAWESEENPSFLAKNHPSLKENDLLFELCKEFRNSDEIIPVHISLFNNRTAEMFALSCVKFLAPLNFEEGLDKARKEQVKQKIYELIKFIYDSDKENLQALVNICRNPVCPITASFFESLSKPLFTFLALEETPELQEKFKKEVYLLIDRWWENEASFYPEPPPSILKPTSSTGAKRNSLTPPLPSEFGKKRAKLANKDDAIFQITFSRNIPPPRDLTSSENPPTQPFSSLKVTQLRPPPTAPQTEEAPLQAPLNRTADLASSPSFSHNRQIFSRECSPSHPPPPVEYELIFISKGAMRNDPKLEADYLHSASEYPLDRRIAATLFQKGKQGLESLPKKIKKLLPETTNLTPPSEEETYTKIDAITAALREESVRNLRSWKTDGNEKDIAAVFTTHILYALRDTPLEVDKQYIFAELPFRLEAAINQLPLNTLNSKMRNDLINAFANYIEQGGNNLTRLFLYVLFRILPDEAPLYLALKEKEPAPSPVINSINSMPSQDPLLQATALPNSDSLSKQRTNPKSTGGSNSTITFSRPAPSKSNPPFIAPRSGLQTEAPSPQSPPVEYEITFTSIEQLLSDEDLQKNYLNKTNSSEFGLDVLIATALFRKGKQGLESLPETIKTLLPNTTSLTKPPEEELNEIIKELRKITANKIRSLDQAAYYMLEVLQGKENRAENRDLFINIKFLLGTTDIKNLKRKDYSPERQKSVIKFCADHIEQGGNCLNELFILALLRILPKEAPFDYSITQKKPLPSSVTASIDLALTEPSLSQASALPNSDSLSKQRPNPKPTGGSTPTITFSRPTPPKKAPPSNVMLTKPQPRQTANPIFSKPSTITFSNPTPSQTTAPSSTLMNKPKPIPTSRHPQPTQSATPIFSKPASTITFTKNTLMQKPSTAPSSAMQAGTLSTPPIVINYSLPGPSTIDFLIDDLLQNKDSAPTIVIDGSSSTASSSAQEASTSSTITFSNGTSAPHQNKTSAPTIVLDGPPSTASSTIEFLIDDLLQNKDSAPAIVLDGPPSTASSSAQEANTSSTITFSNGTSAPHQNKDSAPTIVIDGPPSTASSSAQEASTSSSITFSNGPSAPHQNKTSAPTIVLDGPPSTASSSAQAASTSSSNSATIVPSYTVIETFRNGNCLVDGIALWMLRKGKRNMGIIPAEIQPYVPQNGLSHPETDQRFTDLRIVIGQLLRKNGAAIIRSWEMNDPQTAAILASIHEAMRLDDRARGLFSQIQFTLKNLEDIDLTSYRKTDRETIRTWYAFYIEQDCTYLDSPFLSAISQFLPQGVQVVSINQITNKSYFPYRPEFFSPDTITVFREEEAYQVPQTGEQIVVQHYKGLKWNSN